MASPTASGIPSQADPETKCIGGIEERGHVAAQAEPADGVSEFQFVSHLLQGCDLTHSSIARNPQARIAAPQSRFSKSAQEVWIVFVRDQPADGEPDKLGFFTCIRDADFRSNPRTARAVGCEFLYVDAIENDRALAARHGPEAGKTIGRGLAHGDRATAQEIREPIGEHPIPSPLVHVVHGGEDDKFRTRQTKEPGKDVGVKAMTVDQIRLKLAQECAPSLETLERAPRRFAHVEVNGGDRGGPLCRQARHQHQQCDGVTARGHSIRDGQRLLFCPAHAKRREQVDDTHGTRALLESQRSI